MRTTPHIPYLQISICFSVRNFTQFPKSKPIQKQSLVIYTNCSIFENLRNASHAGRLSQKQTFEIVKQLFTNQILFLHPTDSMKALKGSVVQCQQTKQVLKITSYSVRSSEISSEIHHHHHHHGPSCRQRSLSTRLRRARLPAAVLTLNVNNDGRTHLIKGRIAAAHGRFNAFASPCLILW